MEIIPFIQQYYPQLTRKQKQIADYLLANPESVCYISLRDLADCTRVSEITILRMCQKLGFGNYIELKQAFRAHTRQLVKSLSEPHLVEPGRALDGQADKLTLIRQVADSEERKGQAFFAQLDAAAVLRAAQAIYRAQTVIICGHGVSQIIGEFFCHRLRLLNVPARFVSPSDMDRLQSGISRMRPGDHLVAITFPRYYAPLRNIALFAQARGATVTAISDSSASPIFVPGSIPFICPSTTRMFYNSLAIPIALVNLIASGVVAEMGPQYEKLVAQRQNAPHPEYGASS